MIPLMLSGGLKLALVGRGGAAARRVGQILAGGATDLAVYSDRPDAALREAAGDRLRPRLPDGPDLRGLAALWVVGLEAAEAEALHQAARAGNILVNVEDVPGLCDFHSPALVRRGDLLLTVSTGGRSPRLAARLRAALEQRFGTAWTDRVAAAGRLRDEARRAGHDGGAISRETDRLIDAEGWLA